MPTIRLIPSTYEVSSSTYLSVSNASNMYNNTDNETYATITNTQTGTTSYYLYIRGFNFSSIPASATINSFTVKLKARESGVTTNSSYSPKLCNGTSQLTSTCSAISTTATVWSFTGVSADWEEIAGYDSNFGIRINCRRNNRNTTAYMYVYGAEIEVNYTVPVSYNITTTSATSNIDSFSPTGLTTVGEGDDYELSIVCDDISKIRVKDNGTDVTSSLVYVQGSTETSTFIPSAYDAANSQVAGTDATNVPANGLTDANSTTRATFTSNTTANSATRIYYNFDCSSIPDNAIITSVACSFKATCNNSYFTTRVGQLCTGTTKKGSGTTITNTTVNGTVNVQQIADTGTWTRAELDDIKILIEAIRGTSTSTFNPSFYGATLTITYTVPDHYEYSLTNVQADHTIIIEDGSQFVNTILTTNKVSSIVPEGSTELDSGDSFTLRINATSLEDIKVTDNGEVVTNQVTEHTEQGQSGSPTFNPASYDSGTFTTSTNTTYQTSNGLTDTSSTTYARFTVTTTAQYCIYNFNVTGIPANATITSVSCSVKAYATNAAISTRNVQLYSGTTAMGAAYTLPTSSSTFAITNPGTWTADQLANAKLRFDGQRTGTSTYYIRFYGANLTVNYTVPGEKYYTYTISSVTEEHTIVVADDIMDIPEEDENYNYYSVTVSSINATTTPGKGTTRVRSGTNQTILIYPSDPQLTLLTDNGVDITNQLIMHGGTPTYTVTTQVSDASYGFTLNNSTGYYVSDNKGVDKSAAVCRVNFDLPARCLVTISYINYAESTYDFGIFGNIDTALNGNYKPASGNMPDSSYKLACNTAAMNTSSVQTITYEISADEHYIDIKFSKDDATSSNNDTLQWKITNIEMLDTPDDAYYEYDLSNITQDHSLIFIFGNVTYYFVNSEGTNCRLFPAGSMVQLPGDKYEITVIPDDPDYDIKMTDNNVDVTSSVVRKEVELEKDGNTYTVVNFIYTISNVQATHNLVITCGPSTVLYIKINNAWIQATKIYKKISGTWVEQTDYTTVFDPNQIYVSGS